MNVLPSSLVEIHPTDLQTVQQRRVLQERCNTLWQRRSKGVFRHQESFREYAAVRITEF